MVNNQQNITNLMSAFAIIGVLVSWFFGSRYETPATASIYGYGVVAISLIIIMFNDFSLAQKETSVNKNSLYFAFEMFKSSMPILVTFSLLCYIISLNLTYYNRINDNDVAKEYFKMSIVSTFLILAQIYMVIRFINTNIAISRGTKKANPFKPIIYLFSFLNIIFVGILTIILKYFSTDG